MWFVCSVTNKQLCHGKNFSSCLSWGCFQQHWKLRKGHGWGHISSWWWSVGEKNVVFVCSCTYSANRGIPFWSQNSYYIALLRFCANIIISLTLWESAWANWLFCAILWLLLDSDNNKYKTFKITVQFLKDYHYHCIDFCVHLCEFYGLK